MRKNACKNRGKNSGGKKFAIRSGDKRLKVRLGLGLNEEGSETVNRVLSRFYDVAKSQFLVFLATNLHGF